jgi:hypothetical protein
MHRPALAAAGTGPPGPALPPDASASPQSDFDAICADGRLGAWLDELDALCAARGISGMGVDAPATRCVPAAVRAFKRLRCAGR